MQCELKELNTEMGYDEYEMYQDIPSKELGSTNLCKGLPYEVFVNFIENELAKKYQKVSYYGTPVITFLMYVDNKPVGYISLRTEIDEQWKYWSGNIFYAIRLSERGKGYGKKMLELGLQKLKELGFKEAFAQANKNNIPSIKTMQSNGGILINEDESYSYKFIL